MSDATKHLVTHFLPASPLTPIGLRPMRSPLCVERSPLAARRLVASNVNLCNLRNLWIRPLGVISL
jgi:hypothetical protein